VSVVRDGDGRPIHLISQMQDITARRAAERELAERALHDPLTGLPNRLLFTDRVQVALARSDRTGATVAVFFIDLDRFKLVNDSLGHAAGDRLLVEVAERLRGELRPSDTIARFGGDEFTVLCEQCTEPRATLVAERILASLARPFMIDGHELFANASIGIAFGHGSDAAAPVLLRNADAAMYRAKECGRSQFAVYDGGMHRLATVRLELENDLRHAIERGELRLEYQPDVSLGNRRIVGVEALLRWQHPRHGLLEPRQFVSIAEESGMIVPIGEWVIREACRQARELEDAGHPLVVAVNLSPRQLADPRLPAVLDAAIDETGVDPRLLCLEITESAAVEAQGLALASLRELGVRLALDDFGAGFSSLSQIRALPRVDTLKVDRVFTESLGERPEDDAIVAAIVGMADALEMDTVAEGIETEMQARAVAALGCRRGQGYHFARPLSSVALRRLVESAALRSEAGEAEAAEATGDPAELGAR
jgi:diguanylate cyclase (GGDEF)-like protein